MDRKEKDIIKAELSKHLDLANGRFTDYELERLQEIVRNRDVYNGRSKPYQNSGKTFDSEDTYHYTETKTYTFVSDTSGIRIKYDYEKNYDDGQQISDRLNYTTGRDILRYIDKIIR